jgi:catechol 2,3-dioxygenase-like lactoylglutathione lyase family enzyme
MASVKVQALDHIVVKCADVEKSLAWYTDVLGLPAERVDEWRAGAIFFPSVRIDAQTIIDLFPGARDGENVDHFCVVIDPVDFDAIVASGAFNVLSGPGTRWGARGEGTSLYVSDPDGNTIELRYYGGVDGRA